MRVGAKERAEARAVAEMPGSFAECWREIQDLRAEVERLRGIVQADLEEKAEAWGAVERMRGIARDALHRHQTGIRYIVRGKEDEVLVFLREWTLVADSLSQICNTPKSGPAL